MRPSARHPSVAALLVAVSVAMLLNAAAPAHADVQPTVPTDSPAVDPSAPPAVDPTPPTAVDPAAPSRLDLLLHRRMSDPRLGRNVGFIVTDAITGAVLSEHRADVPLQGASNMKIVTAVTALATMGPDRRFPTTVVQGAEPGHLVLRGGGDPLLTRGNLKALARTVAATVPPGPRFVIDIDTTLFAAPTKAPGWVPAYLGSSVGMVEPLSLVGDRSRRPGRVVVAEFVSLLRGEGVRARVGSAQPTAPEAPIVAQVPGHSVAEAVALMLRASDSAVAEILFRHVAIATGQPPTWEGGQNAAFAVVASLGLDIAGVRLVDGSGLSRHDRLTPRFLTSLLRTARVDQAPRFAAMFEADAMPVAGQTGTLTAAYGRYNTRPSRCASGAVQAKTGTILGTIALSGIAMAGDAPRLFSFIVNDRPQRFDVLSTRRAVDSLAATVTGCWD